MVVFVFMGNGGQLLAKQPEETSQKRLVLEMNGYADVILANAKNLDYNTAKGKGDPKYDAAQIQNYAGKLKEAVASIYGASPATSEKFKAIAENAEKMLRNVPDDPPTAQLYAEDLKKAVAALKESDIPAAKAQQAAGEKAGRGSKLDMQKAIEVIPIDTMEGMRRLVHSLNENSGSDITVKRLKMTPGQERVIYTESIDVLSSSGLITPSQKYLITEKGKNLFSEGGKHQFSEELAKLNYYIAIMTVHLDRVTANQLADYLASLPEGQRERALWDPSRATSDAADKVFETLRVAGKAVTSKDRDHVEAIGYAIAQKIDVPTLKIKEIKAAIAEERLALKAGRYDEAKPLPVLSPGELWVHPKEQAPVVPSEIKIDAAMAGEQKQEKTAPAAAVKKEGVEKKGGNAEEPLAPFADAKGSAPLGWHEQAAEEKPAAEKKAGRPKRNVPAKAEEDLLGDDVRERVLDFRDRRMAQTIERRDKDYLASEKARAQREADAKKKPATPEKKEIAPPKRKEEDVFDADIPVSRVIMPKNKAIGKEAETGGQEKAGGKEEGKQSIFKVYPEFSGKEMKSGIDWADKLWAEEEFVKRFGSKELSADPKVRKAAVEKFIEYVKDKDNRSTYQDMEPKNADMLMKILDSFKE